MAPMETSSATLEMANTLTPMGGVICPISMMITVSTPNQMGSNPRAVTVGKIAGSVSNIMGMTFIRQPSRAKSPIILASTM